MGGAGRRHGRVTNNSGLLHGHGGPPLHSLMHQARRHTRRLCFFPGRHGRLFFRLILNWQCCCSDPAAAADAMEPVQQHD